MADDTRPQQVAELGPCNAASPGVARQAARRRVRPAARRRPQTRSTSCSDSTFTHRAGRQCGRRRSRPAYIARTGPPRLPATSTCTGSCSRRRPRRTWSGSAPSSGTPGRTRRARASLCLSGMYFPPQGIIPAADEPLTDRCGRKRYRALPAGRQDGRTARVWAPGSPGRRRVAFGRAAGSSRTRHRVDAAASRTLPAPGKRPAPRRMAMRLPFLFRIVRTVPCPAPTRKGDDARASEAGSCMWWSSNRPPRRGRSGPGSAGATMCAPATAMSSSCRRRRARSIPTPTSPWPTRRPASGPSGRFTRSRWRSRRPTA